MMEGIKYAGDDDEFIISLETLLDLLEARITVLRTDGSRLGEAINSAFDNHSVSSYTVAESMVSNMIDGNDTDLGNLLECLFG